VTRVNVVVVRNEILSGGSWWFDKAMVVVVAYNVLSDPSLLDLHIIRVSVQLKNLPHALKFEKVGWSIGANVGPVLKWIIPMCFKTINYRFLQVFSYIYIGY
jgi:hypothetical protein